MLVSPSGIRMSGKPAAPRNRGAVPSQAIHQAPRCEAITQPYLAGIAVMGGDGPTLRSVIAVNKGRKNDDSTVNGIAINGHQK